MTVPRLDIIYYVACSLDGFIATADGGVEWLDDFQGQGEDYGYAEFYGSCDALIMGSHTYEVSLKFGDWPSKDKPSWVFTNRELAVVDPSITLTSDEPAAVVKEMHSKGIKQAWMMGGGKLAGSFLEAVLLTEFRVFVMPVILGDGIPLLAGVNHEHNLRLTKAESYDSGVVELRYVKGID